MTNQQYATGGNVTPPPPPYIPALAGRLSQSSRALGFFSLVVFMLTNVILCVMIFAAFILGIMHALSAAYGWTMLGVFSLCVSSIAIHLWNEER